MMHPNFEDEDWKRERSKRWSDWVLPYLGTVANRKEIKYLERIYWGEDFDKNCDDFEQYMKKRHPSPGMYVEFMLLSPVQTQAVWQQRMMLGGENLRTSYDLRCFLGFPIDQRRYGWDTETAVEWTDLLVTSQLGNEKYAPFGVDEFPPFEPKIYFIDEYLSALQSWIYGWEYQGWVVKDGNKWARLNHLLEKIFELMPDCLFDLSFDEGAVDYKKHLPHFVRNRKRIHKMLYLSFDFEGRYEKVFFEGCSSIGDLGDVAERRCFLSGYKNIFLNNARYSELCDAASGEDFSKE